MKPEAKEDRKVTVGHNSKVERIIPQAADAGNKIA
jgi:hypothetical protein